MTGEIIPQIACKGNFATDPGQRALLHRRPGCVHQGRGGLRVRDIMNEKVTTILPELRGRLEALYSERLVRMVLFGSQARGDAEPESDIDVLVVLQGPVDPGEEIARTGEVTAWISLKHNVVISRVFVSAEQFIEQQSP